MWEKMAKNQNSFSLGAHPHTNRPQLENRAGSLEWKAFYIFAKLYLGLHSFVESIYTL